MRSGFLRRLEQMRAFEQAAEIFFAGDNFRAFLVAEVGHGFVFHFEPFEADDADVFPTLFPDLALAQIHGMNIRTGHGHWRAGLLQGNLSLLIFASGETASNGGYLFLAAADFAATAALFLALALLALDCFWPDFFWLAFGDLSPIILFIPQVDSPTEF
jgi:hypothetical protein